MTETQVLKELGFIIFFFKFIRHRDCLSTVNNNILWFTFEETEHVDNDRVP